MTACWIGLARVRRGRTRLAEIVREGARAAGAAGVLVLAAGFNFALQPEALARALPFSIVTFVDAEPAPVTSVNEADVRLLAATAWGEARSEGEDGMRAVAHVIVNRMNRGFGENIEGVVRAPWQFSVWNRRDPNRRRVENPDAYARSGADLETWEIAQRVAREVLVGQSTDPTNGALFYHTTAIRPWWSRYGEGRRVIGAHVFYSDVRRSVQFVAAEPEGDGATEAAVVAATQPELLPEGVAEDVALSAPSIATQPEGGGPTS
jgi:hypothetical protein